MKLAYVTIRTVHKSTLHNAQDCTGTHNLNKQNRKIIFAKYLYKVNAQDVNIGQNSLPFISNNNYYKLLHSDIWWDVGCTIFSFICLCAEIIER